jgi:hypothetical protein
MAVNFLINGSLPVGGFLTEIAGGGAAFRK